MTRSGAVPSKIRKRPSLVSSMSWPVTVANSAGRLGHPGVQPLAPQGVVGPVGVADQRVHQRLAGGPIGPVTGRLARRGVVVLALQPRSHLGLERGRAGPQQPPDRPPQHRHGVLGGDRVLQRRRVQHPLDPDQPHLAGQLAGHPEDPIRIRRAAQPRPQIHQHGVGEAGRLLPSHRIGHPGRIPPAHIEGEPVGRLPIRQALQPLQHHHHGQDRRRHRAPPGRLEQVREQLGREQPGPLPGQEPVHRPLRQGRLTPAGTSGGQLRAAQLAAEGHNRSSRSGDKAPGVCQLSRSTTNQTQNSGHLAIVGRHARCCPSATGYDASQLQPLGQQQASSPIRTHPAPLARVGLPGSTPTADPVRRG